MNIVGIGGLPRSGKDSLAELFIEKGYFGVSLGDIVRDESRKRHADEPDAISVKNMTETANYMRSAYGPDFALKQAIDRYKEASKTNSYKGLVVFSVRAPVEADFILGHNGRLIWVETSDEIRYKRALQHLREGETEISLEDMKSQEALQEQPQPGIPEEDQMNTTYIKEHATEVFKNNGNDIEVFKAQAEKVLGLAE